MGLITEQEFKTACEKELAEELEENPGAGSAFLAQPMTDCVCYVSRRRIEKDG